MMMDKRRLYWKEFLRNPLPCGLEYCKNSEPRVYNHLVLRAQCIIIIICIVFHEIIEYSCGRSVINRGGTSSFASPPNIRCTELLLKLLFLF
jgi:hypothetical protein